MSGGKIAVIYYSATGHVHQLAQALANGAADAGANVRLRRVAELALEEVVRGQDAWHAHYLGRRQSAVQHADERPAGGRSGRAKFSCCP